MRWPLILLVALATCHGFSVEFCTKKETSPDLSGPGLRLKCSGTQTNRITSIKQLNLQEVATEITLLDLADNHIQSIDATDFANMTNLRRLNVANNSISHIDSSAFEYLFRLEVLKLSQNLIAHIYNGTFDSLIALKSLDISSNPLVCDCNLLWINQWSVTNRSVALQRQPKCEAPPTFKGFLIKRIRIGVDVHCDSQLQTQLELYPESDQLVFEGDQLLLRCRAPRVAIGTMMDSEDLPARSHIFWGWSPNIIPAHSTDNITFFEPISHFPSIGIEASPVSDGGFLTSSLRVPMLHQNMTGTWNCRLRSPHTSFTHSISLVVVSKGSKYCAAQETADNKGTYHWPRTVRGHRVALSCTGEGGPLHAMAYHRCNETGYWDELDTSHCPFVRESTKILDLFSKDNLTVSPGQIVDRAKRLKNYTDVTAVGGDDKARNATAEGFKFSDPIDVIFIAKTMINYLNVIGLEQEVGSVLMDIVSQLLNYPAELLRRAQQMAGACNKIVHVAEVAASVTPTQHSKKANLAMELFDTNSSSSGKTCVWFKSNIIQPDGRVSDKRTLQCNIGVVPQSIGYYYDKRFDASIYFPPIFSHFPVITSSGVAGGGGGNAAPKLLVSVFQNSNLFPHSDKSPYIITSCVIGAKLLNVGGYGGGTSNQQQMRGRENLTDPIVIMLRARPFHHELSAPKPVWWDPELNNGLGGWSPQGCLYSYMLQGMFVFACSKLGYYGLIQHTRYLNDSPDENSGARFRLLHPAIYAGSVSLFVCLWLNIVTYLVHGKRIRMARKARHALVNTWLSLAALLVVFNVGIFQTEDYKVCQGFGVAVHYFSLCVLFWLCVSVSSMLKRMKRMGRTPPYMAGRLTQDDLLKEEMLQQMHQQPINGFVSQGAVATARKPILGIYLVGYGIALIICLISAAVNIREYASYSQCFMRSGPALSAVFVPAVIVILFLCLLFMVVRCNLRETIHRNDLSQLAMNGNLTSRETNATDLQHLMGGGASESQATTTTTTAALGNHYQRISQSIPTGSSSSNFSGDDLECSYVKQLKAFVFMLIFYTATWTAGAMSAAMPFSEKILYGRDVFSALYAFLAVVLGLFVLYFYVVARADVRSQWRIFDVLGMGGKAFCCRPRSVADAKLNNGMPMVVSYTQQRPNEVGMLMMMPVNGTLRTSVSGTRSVSRSNSRRTAPSPTNSKLGGGTLQRQQMLRGYPMDQIGEGSASVVGGPAGMGVGAMGEPNAEMFYNPQQSNVARKFFKRQKRLAKQQQTLEMHIHRRGLASSEYGDTQTLMGNGGRSGGGGKEMIIQFPKPPPPSTIVYGNGDFVQQHLMQQQQQLNNLQSQAAMQPNYNNTVTADRGVNGRPMMMYPTNVLSDSCNESEMNADSFTDRLLNCSEKITNEQGDLMLVQLNESQQSEENIYSNATEVELRPQHEIVTIRLNDKFREEYRNSKLEYEREEGSSINNNNNCNNKSIHGGALDDSEELPRYANEHSFAKYTDEEGAEDDDDDCGGGVGEESGVGGGFEERPLLEFCPESNHLILSLSSPTATAIVPDMNTVGLPVVEPLMANGGLEGDHEPYVSEVLEIGGGTLTRHSQRNSSTGSAKKKRNERARSVDDLQAAATMRRRSRRNSRNGEGEGEGSSDGETDMANCCQETRTRSISFNNISLLLDVDCAELAIGGVQAGSTDLPGERSLEGKPRDRTPLQARRRDGGESPILFSPSLCDLPAECCDHEGMVAKGVAAGKQDLGKRNFIMFSPAEHRLMFTSSPTNDSDVNYQNSELSIRSHGFYQDEISLTAEDVYYQTPSDISQMLKRATDGEEAPEVIYSSGDEEDEDGDDTGELIVNENGELIRAGSIDELYQQITRGK